MTLLAEIYRYIGDYSEAFTAIRRPLYISEKYGNKHTQLHALDTIATIYLDEGKINEATSYIQQALDIAIGNDHSSLVFVQTTMGRMFKLQGNAHLAIEWGKKAVELAQNYNIDFDKGWSNLELGQSYVENEYIRKLLMDLSNIGFHQNPEILDQYMTWSKMIQAECSKYLK